MADEPYDPKKHGPLPTTPTVAAVPAEEPYDPTKHGSLPVYQPSVDTGSGQQPDTPSAMNRPADARGVKPIAEDVLTRAASSMTFGTAEKMSALIDSQLGKGSYDALLAKRREETQQAGDRLGPAGAFLSDVAGGVLTGSALQKLGLTILGRLPATAPLVQKILAGSAEGGAYGALQGAGHTDTGKIEDYVKNALTSGGWGALVGGGTVGAVGGAQRVATPFPSTLTPAQQQMAQTLTKEGVDLSAGTRTGNPKLRLGEDIVGKLPLGGGDPSSQQMAQVTQAAMRKAGLGGGGAATPDVIDQGFNTVGGAIGKIQQQYPIQFDNHLVQTLVDTQDAAKVLGTSEQGIVNAFINRILKPGATMDPEAMQSLRTDLRLSIQKGPDAKPLFNRAIEDLRDALDDALTRTIQRSGNNFDAVQLQQLRQQYANLNTLADAVGSSGKSGQAGELTPTALAGALARSVGKRQYVRGQGDYNDLARASAGLLQSPKDSYTATREFTMNPAKWLLGAAGRAGLTSGPAQRYWGNQAAATPVPPSLLQAPVAGAAAAGAQPGQPGPADRIMSLLMSGGG